MDCSFCGRPAVHPATGCAYGERTVVCRACVLEFWAWALAHLFTKGGRRGALPRLPPVPGVLRAYRSVRAVVPRRAGVSGILPGMARKPRETPEHAWRSRAPISVGREQKEADRCFFCGATRIRMGSKFGDDGREVVEYAYRVPGVVDPMDGKKGPPVRVEREPKCPGVPRWGGG